MDEPIISFDGVTKKFFIQEYKTFKESLPHLIFGKPWAREITVLNNISFSIRKGESVGIIGKNGAGKSTILKLIAGVTSPSQGKLNIVGRVAPLIELGAGFHHELTGYENIFLNSAILGMHKKEIEMRVDSIVEFSGLKDFLNVPVKRYSSGMYMRLAFSVAIHVDASILLIDEVLSVGDQEFQKKCLIHINQLKRKREKIIIFVSHSEQAVKNFCDRVILINHGEIASDGQPQKVLEDYHRLPAE